jgi:hypothetical protein
MDEAHVWLMNSQDIKDDYEFEEKLNHVWG